MKAEQDGSDRSDCSASSLSLEELFSVLMYYGHMSKAEILSSSRRFLIAIYQSYVRRACENLGVSPDGDSKSQNSDGTMLSESDYPSEFVSFSQAEREKYLSECNESSEDFMSKFPKVKW